MSALKHAQIGITRDCLVILSFFTLFVWAAPVGTETPGLVAAYGFNEPSGKTITDVSGNNNRSINGDSHCQ